MILLAYKHGLRVLADDVEVSALPIAGFSSNGEHIVGLGVMTEFAQSSVESVEEIASWKEERITFDAAYGSEKVIAYLFLPKNAKPPFQTAVIFTGVAAFYAHSSKDLSVFINDFDFLIKGGRSVMFPIYKGTFNPWHDFKRYPKDIIAYRDHVVAWSKDLGRSIDYLETRSDIDRNKFAYVGDSW